MLFIWVNLIRSSQPHLSERISFPKGWRYYQLEKGIWKNRREHCNSDESARTPIKSRQWKHRFEWFLKFPDLLISRVVVRFKNNHVRCGKTCWSNDQTDSILCFLLGAIDWSKSSLNYSKCNIPSNRFDFHSIVSEKRNTTFSRYLVFVHNICVELIGSKPQEETSRSHIRHTRHAPAGFSSR